MSNDYLGDELKNKEAQRASLFLSLTVRGVPEGWRFVNRRMTDTPAYYRYEEQFCGDISTRKVMTDYIENRFNSLVRKGYIQHYKIRITQGG